MPHIRILAEAVLKISCIQGFSTLESKKGRNFAILGPTVKKKICIRLFFVLMLHIKFQVLRSSGSLVLLPTKDVIKRQTDGQTQTNMLPQLLRSWEHKNCRHWLTELCLICM